MTFPSHASALDVAIAPRSCDRLGHPRSRRRLHRHRFGFGAPNDGGVAARRGAARACVCGIYIPHHTPNADLISFHSPRVLYW